MLRLSRGDCQLHCFMQGASEGIKIAPFARHTSGVPFVFLTMIILAAGTSVLRWLSDSVEARGLGDGISLLIALNIVSSESCKTQS